MKRLLTLLALVLCSCAETFVGEEIARPNNGNLPDLTAAFAEAGDTRTYIEEGKYLRWNEDDRLTIFFGNTLNRQYKFNGATGDNSGTFSLVPDGMLGTGNAFDHIYALYPYNANARITDEGVISLTLPAEQDYAENSFGRGANTMIAVTENLEDTFLAFKNACGYLKLKLYNAEGATIKSIEVKGNSGERLAGAATATIAFGEAPVLAMADDATTLVTLNCGEGVALGTTAETATEFWFVLPATTFAEGLTITATDTEGSIFEKSTTNEVVIERNAIQPMAVLEAKFVATKPANNEIWYTNGSTTEATTPNNTNAFGANIVSNTYDTAKECWVIKFDGDVTTIGDYAFRYCSSLTSVTIPDSVTTIGKRAFSGCSSVTSVTIGDSVTTIGGYAFGGCNKITEVNISDISAWCKIDFIDGDTSDTTSVSANPLCAGGRLYLNGEIVKDLVIPSDITEIKTMAFRGCSSLTSVTIPDSVTTIGYVAFRCCSSLTSVTIGDSVTEIGNDAFSNCSSLISVTIPDSVTTIGNYAFKDCSSLTSVTIGDSVTTIGKYAFYDCSSLTSVYCKAITPPAGGSSMFSYNASDLKIYVPMESVEAYKSASYWSDYAYAIVGYDFENGEVVTDNKIWYTSVNGNIVTPWNTDAFGAIILSNTYIDGQGVITFDKNVKTIGDNAFACCDELRTITIPDVVSTIGSSAFAYCEDLVSVTIGDSVTTIGDSAFYDCENLGWVTIGDSVTTIGSSAFKFCNISSVTIPDSVTTIGSSAFYGCSLTSLTIPDSVTAIGGSAFYQCTDLTSVTIGDGVMTIGGFAFYGCYSLTSVTIGDSVTTIGGSAFYGCTRLESVTIPDSVTTIGHSAFRGCSSLTSVTIGDGVTTIGERAFYSCNSLRSVTIPDSVTKIGEGAFWGCTSLTSVTIPDSVTTIGGSAFYGCTRLKSVTIPDSVTTIGYEAFRGCSSLTSVCCKAITPPVALLNDGYWFAFYDNASDLKIYVPMESVEAYKSASGWSGYESYIRGYDFDNTNYIITLNNAWRQSTSVSNPDSSLYDGVYESYSNYNKDNGVATMYIDIEGYTEFSIYVRSDAESTYDYVTVSELDSTTQKMSTSGKQNSGTAISNYTKVTYTGIDCGKHRITVIYKKDSSQHRGTDRGYLIIPKNQ